MCSTINPFSVIIASDAAGIDWTTGLEGRLLMWLVSLVLCILYILRYAKRVKKDLQILGLYPKAELEAGLWARPGHHSQAHGPHQTDYPGLCRHFCDHDCRGLPDGLVVCGNDGHLHGGGHPDSHYWED